VCKRKPIRMKRTAKLALEGSEDDFPDITKRRQNAILRGEMDEFGRPIKPLPSVEQSPEFPIADPPAEIAEVPTLLDKDGKPIIPSHLQDNLDEDAKTKIIPVLHRTPLLPIPETDTIRSDESETETIQDEIETIQDATVDQTLADLDVEPCLHILCR